jgi:hypothetical protein
MDKEQDLRSMERRYRRMDEPLKETFPVSDPPTSSERERIEQTKLLPACVRLPITALGCQTGYGLFASIAPFE